MMMMMTTTSNIVAPAATGRADECAFKTKYIRSTVHIGWYFHK